jgi:penicillin-binding protein 1A
MATDVDPSPHKLTLLERRRLRKATKRSLFWRWRRLFFLLMLLAVVAMAGVWLVLSSIALPDRDEQLAETTFICTREVVKDCDADTSTAQLNGEENRVLVDYEDLPDVLIDAVIAGEDQDFFNHNGIDPVGISRAAYADIRGASESVQGGSTITQQYVKNVFLTNERTLVRKLREAVLAVKLEDELEKEEILERYLNTVYFGRGAYGVEAASKVYFGKNVGRLSIPDAAYLAGLIRSPETADAEFDPEVATFRRNSVLDNMLEEGYITDDQHVRASAIVWDVNPYGVGNLLPRVQVDTLGNVKGKEYGTEYFAEYVRQELVEIFNGDEERVYGGGLRVYTTLDHEWQRQAYETVTNTLGPDDPSASIVAIGARGRVRAMMGGRNFSESEVNLAVGADGGGSGRQPGSSFKPFALTEALRQGYSVESRLPAPSSRTFDLNGEEWVVTAGSGQGSMDLATATQFSNNVVYAGLMLELGTENVLRTAQDLGVESELPNVPSIVLGAGEVSVLDMASAYSTLRESGTHYDPVVIERVENSSGEVLWEADSSPEQVVSEQVADTVTYALQKVIEGGTGTAADIAQDAAGKTGTTDDNKDAWFVGYTCDVTTAVWMGNVGFPGQEIQPMSNVQGVQVQGGNFPARMWAEFMTRIDPLVDSDCAFADVSDFSGELEFGDGDEDADADTIEPDQPTAPVEESPISTAPPATAPPATTIPPATTAPPPPTTAPGGGGGGNAGGAPLPLGDGDDP